MINELLKKLDFNEKEITVYLTILEHGKITAANVAKLTKINRTTVYSIAKELSQKGVIREDLGSSPTYLVALPPEEWGGFIKKEEKKLAEKKRLVNLAIKELGNLGKNTKYSIPKITFIDEENLEQYLYQRAESWNNSTLDHDGIWWGFQDHNFVRYYEEWIDWTWVKFNKKIAVKLLSNEVAEQIKNKKFPLREIKFWNQSHNFSATTWVCGDYVVMAVTHQRPHYLVEIHDTVLAHNMREIFKGIWKENKFN